MKLNDLIEQHNSQFSTFYSEELYSHTPMALISLSEMGASDQRLEEHFLEDTKKLEQKKKLILKLDQSNWKSYLGKFEYEASFIQFFEEEFNELGQEKILAKYFDFLMKGVGAAAFHPLIRLSYAIKRNDIREVIQSLATWAASFLDLKINSQLNEKLSIEEIISKLQSDNFNNGEKLEGDTIARRMVAVSESNEFKGIADKVFLNELEGNNLESILLRLFSQTNNFTLLHAVTSHHAFEYLKKFSVNERNVKVYYWKTLLAAYLTTTGASKISLNWSYPEIKLPSWDKLKDLAIESKDNHVIKLVHTLSEKNRSDLDSELRYAASLKLKAI